MVKLGVFGQALIKSPKIFWTDTGLAAYLLNIYTDEELSRSPFFGNLFENWIVMEIYKQFSSLGIRPAIWFWRTSNGMEVDLIVEHKGKLWPIEIKSGGTFNKSWLKGINCFANTFNSDTVDGTIINTGEHGTFNHNVFLFDVKNW